MMPHELHRLITALLPSTSTLHLTALTLEQESVVLHLTATAPTAACSCCTVPSSSVHSRYGRHATDLPFHLVQNLPRALEALLLDRRPALQAAAVGTAMALTQADGSLPAVSLYRGRRQGPKPAELREDTAQPPRHARWGAIDEVVHTLRAQGMPLATIARRLGISRTTVALTSGATRRPA